MRSFVFQPSQFGSAHPFSHWGQEPRLRPLREDVCGLDEAETPQVDPRWPQPLQVQGVRRRIQTSRKTISDTMLQGVAGGRKHELGDLDAWPYFPAVQPISISLSRIGQAVE